MNQVSVQFLGSGDNFGSGGRFQTCIYVHTGKQGFLIDMGASSLIAMKRFGVETTSVDFILLSHLHGDHFGGLPFFILESQMISRRKRPIIVAGPSGLEDRIFKTMEALFPGSTHAKRDFSIDFVEFADRETIKIGSISVTPHLVIHPSGASAYALRIECRGKIIAYSGDTEWTDRLIDVSSKADLFICEAYFYEKEIRYHLNYRTLMLHRSELNCKRLILTHMSEDMLGRLPGIDTEWAEDGKRVLL
ncbi:MAG: MBL fold metallo-hydrolase [Desulfobacterales bacterium]|jgi:ribonuclease BN (tRNA processing enzyme)